MSQIRELRIELILLKKARRNLWFEKNCCRNKSVLWLRSLGLSEAGNKILLRMDGLVSGS